MLDLPPAAFSAQREAADRREYARRYWALVETDHLGVKTTWIGKGPEPEPSYDHDTSARDAHLEALRVAARIPGPSVPTPADALAADRAAWQALRQARRLRA